MRSHCRRCPPERWTSTGRAGGGSRLSKYHVFTRSQRRSPAPGHAANRRPGGCLGPLIGHPFLRNRRPAMAAARQSATRRRHHRRRLHPCRSFDFGADPIGARLSCGPVQVNGLVFAGMSVIGGFRLGTFRWAERGLWSSCLVPRGGRSVQICPRCACWIS